MFPSKIKTQRRTTDIFQAYIHFLAEPEKKALYLKNDGKEGYILHLVSCQVIKYMFQISSCEITLSLKDMLFLFIQLITGKLKSFILLCENNTFLNERPLSAFCFCMTVFLCFKRCLVER